MKRTAALLALAVMFIAAESRANLLQNGGFDAITNATDSDWGGTGWVRPTGANAGHVSWSAFNSAIGMYFPSWDSANNPGILYQDVAVSPGQYTFSAWARREMNANPTNLQLMLEWCDANTNVLQSNFVSLVSLPNDTTFHQFHLTASCSSSSLSFVRAGIYGSWLSTNGSSASLQFDGVSLVAGGYKPELYNGGFETPPANDWVNTFWTAVPDYAANSRQPWANRHGGWGGALEGWQTNNLNYQLYLHQRFYPTYGSNYVFALSLKRESTNMVTTNVELRIEWYDNTFTNQVQTPSVNNLGALTADNNWYDKYVSGACTSPAVAEARVVLLAQWDRQFPPQGGNAAMFDDARLIEGGAYEAYFNNYAGGYRSSAELIPGANVPFFSANYSTKTNTIRVLVRQGVLNQYTGEVGSVGMRYGWGFDTNGGGGEIGLTNAGSITITNTAPFHGIPASGTVVYDIYAGQWPMPMDGNADLFTNGFSIYYSPFVVFTNIASAQESEKIYLVKQGGSITNVLGQQLNSQYAFNDYDYYNSIPSAPATLQNGGFETPGTNNSFSSTGVVWNGFGGTAREDWAPYSGARGGALFTWGDDYGGCYQDVATTGGVYTLTFMFEKEEPVDMATCEVKLEWFSSVGEMVGANTNAITSPSDGRWHRIHMTVTNLHPNISYMRPVLFADWNNATSSYANNDASRYDDFELYSGQLTNTSPFTNADFNLAPGTFTLSKWDGVMNDGPFDYVGIDTWADRLVGGTNWGGDFRGYKNNETTMKGSISQGIVGQGPGTYVFSTWLKRESAMLLSNCVLKIKWHDKSINNTVQADTVLDVTTDLTNDLVGVWQYFAVTGTCADANLFEIRVGVEAVWGVNNGGGNKALMMDDAAFGPAGGGDSDVDGISDAWELFYFGTLTNEWSGDVDGDGSPNGEEYVSDSVPTNNASYFQDQTNATLGAGTTLNMAINPSSTGRVYDAYWKTNLLDSSEWQAYGLSVTGNGGQIILTVTNAQPVRHHRSGVKLP